MLRPVRSYILAIFWYFLGPSEKWQSFFTSKHYDFKSRTFVKGLYQIDSLSEHTHKSTKGDVAGQFLEDILLISFIVFNIPKSLKFFGILAPAKPMRKNSKSRATAA